MITENVTITKKQPPESMMSQSQKAIVLTDLSKVDQNWLQSIKSALNECNLSVVDVLQFGDDPNAAIEVFHANFLVLVANEIDDKTMSLLMEQMLSAATPVIVFEKKENPAHATSFAQHLLCTYLGGDLRLNRLPTILSAAYGRYESFTKLASQLQQTRQQLEDRKDIDRAKGILMDLKNWNEDSAFKHLRSLAMNKGKTIGEVSRLLIEANSII